MKSSRPGNSGGIRSALGSKPVREADAAPPSRFGELYQRQCRDVDRVLAGSVESELGADALEAELITLELPLLTRDPAIGRAAGVEVVW